MRQPDTPIAGGVRPVFPLKERGIAQELCDRIVKMRELPPRLAAALSTYTPPRADRRPVHRLTRREREALTLASYGWNDDAIAAALGVSRWTVKKRMCKIAGELGVSGKASGKGMTRTRSVVAAIRTYEIV